MKTYNSYILFIHFSTSNILFSITNLKGELIKTLSTGTYKTSGVKKISLTSLKTAISSVTRILRYSSIHVKCRGLSRFKRLLIKSILKSPKLKVLTLCDVTVSPHNGVRKSKVRRV
uniref:Ribosomal protein S11 n=1 Tax=Montagnia macrospora TaxID=2662032 RepID=A0A343UXT1_9FLOR|nr:ribosomal protein S11 [Montagnia macrospora]AVK39488.1 ribosomal protein S11 [Montagnia macrospora]